MVDVKSQIAMTEETLPLFTESLLKDTSLKDSRYNELVANESVHEEAILEESVGRDCDDIASYEVRPAIPTSTERDLNFLNVHQAELPLVLSWTNEPASVEYVEVSRLEIPISKHISISEPDVLKPADANHQAVGGLSAAHVKTTILEESSITHGESNLPNAVSNSFDNENSDAMTVRSINRTKPRPTSDIKNSARHLKAAMTLASSLGGALRAEKDFTVKISAAPNGKSQALNLRQQCLDDLGESRRFVKRSKESLLGIARQSRNTLARKNMHQQIGYQRPSIGYSASVDSIQCDNLAPFSLSLEKKNRVNVKKKEQQKRKQTGILICRHLVAALRIQAAHDQKAISS